MSYAEVASLGRRHGKEQNGTTRDCMMFDFQFESDTHWRAYLTGFYRGAGYEGSGNRTIRKKNR